MALDKGHSRALFRGLAIGAWFTGELIGGLIAVLAFRFNPVPNYLIALGGGIGGWGLIALILFLLPVRGASIGPGVAQDWTCPTCGFKNTGWRSRCFKCGAERPAEKKVETRGWTCPGCGSFNLNADGVCYNCKLKNPIAGG